MCMRAADACDGRANVAAASAGIVDPWHLSDSFHINYKY